MSWHFVAALCILSCLHQSVTTGLIPASLSTLERRYELSSVESGLILSTYDIVKLLMVIPVSYLAGKRHIPKAIAFCCVIMSLGCATFAFVHYLSPPYVPQSTTEGESICSDFPIFPPCLNRNSSWLFPLMLIGQAIIAIGAAAVYCIGPAYILSSMDTRYANCNGLFLCVLCCWLWVWRRRNLFGLMGRYKWNARKKGQGVPPQSSSSFRCLGFVCVLFAGGTVLSRTTRKSSSRRAAR